MELYSTPADSPAREFVILIGLWVLGLVAGSLVAFPVWNLLTGTSIFEMDSMLMNPKYHGEMLLIQTISSFFTFFFPAFVTASIMSGNKSTYLGFKSQFGLKAIIYVLIIMFAAIVAGGVLGEINKAIPVGKSFRLYFENKEQEYNDLVKAILLFRNTGDYVLSLLVIGVVPAIAEECMFRGAMQPILIRWFKYPLIGIIVTSFIFSSIHLSWFGLLPRMALGVVLGYIYFYSRNIWYSIIAHFFNNALSVTVLYFSYLKTKKLDLENEDAVPLWGGVIAIAAICYLMLRFKQHLKPAEAESELKHQDLNL